ncbi:holo-ACP synthase, partial [Vibrio echinoideorum]
GVSFHDLEISNDEHGKPVLRLHKNAREIAEASGTKSIHLTFSDERHYAVATVLLES